MWEGQWYWRKVCYALCKLHPKCKTLFGLQGFRVHPHLYPFPPHGPLQIPTSGLTPLLILLLLFPPHPGLLVLAKWKARQKETSGAFSHVYALPWVCTSPTHFFLCPANFFLCLTDLFLYPMEVFVCSAGFLLCKSNATAHMLPSEGVTPTAELCTGLLVPRTKHILGHIRKWEIEGYNNFEAHNFHFAKFFKSDFAIWRRVQLWIFGGSSGDGNCRACGSAGPDSSTVASASSKGRVKKRGPNSPVAPRYCLLEGVQVW